MGQSTQQEGMARQPSGDYAPYPPPVFDQARPGETPGVPSGAGWGTQVMGSPANPAAHPDNSAAAARGFGSGSSSTGPAAAAPQPGQPVYVAQPAPQEKDTFGKLASAMKGMAAKGGESAGKISKYFSSGGNVAETVIGRTTLGFKLLSGVELSACLNPRLTLLQMKSCSRPMRATSVPRRGLLQVMLPLEKVKAINPSTNQTKPDEHYIQVDMVDHHEFWFMGFVNYEKAVKNMREALAKFRPYYAPAGPPPPGAYSHGGSFNHRQNSGPPPQGYPQNTGPPPPGYPQSGPQPQGYQQPLQADGPPPSASFSQHGTPYPPNTPPQY